MIKKRLSTFHLVIASGLAAFSSLVQLVHIGYQSPVWGMWLDIVAVSWLIGFFLYGFSISLLITIIGAVVITVFSPDTWLGAIMKLIATLPTLIIFSIWIKNKSAKYYSSPKKIIIPLTIALIIRCLIILPINYYYAIPFWTGMSPVKAMTVIPWYIIIGFNLAQGLIDVVLSWLLVFKFKLNKYAYWKK